ncbi:MAG: formylglycine-generating enzyme family protein, partial [Planctomycetes bacterium]|nr:formylglycine-generating enzyme family protein [Planctomycetota bacterium]
FQQFVDDTGYRTDAETDGRGGWGYERDGVLERRDFNWRNIGFPQAFNHPVANISWNDASSFCDWLSRKEGKRYYLPSEAAWEYACRAGTTTRYWCGDDPESLADVANFADPAKKPYFARQTSSDGLRRSDGYAFSAPVGRYPSNAFGLYDMHGNVHEWCGDWYDSEYYGRSREADPTGLASGQKRVVRGGSWDLGPYVGRSADRGKFLPSLRSSSTGFRVARTLE